MKPPIICPECGKIYKYHRCWEKHRINKHPDSTYAKSVRWYERKFLNNMGKIADLMFLRSAEKELCTLKFNEYQ